MIGIFDSGVGGFSVLKALKEISPQTDVVYFGDTKNAPYGIRTQDDLKTLTALGVKTLLENGATNILSACNSVSAFMVVDSIGMLSDIPFGIIEMTNPTVSKFSKNKNIAIFATPATIESGVYQDNFRKKGVEIKNFPISKLAGAIEFGKSDEELEKIINKAVLESSRENFDTAILCCTHYSFVKDKFEKAFEKLGKKIELLDPAEVVAEKAIKKFNKVKGNGKLRFIVSKDSPTFRKMVARHFSDFDYTINIL